MEWTDWTPLRGRRVLIWPDCDEAGLINARRLAARLSLIGGVIEYVNWSVEDTRRFAGWDWADDGGFSEIGEGEIRARTMLVESPVGPDGKVLTAWAQRSFLDSSRREVYQVSNGYSPVPLESLAVGREKTFRKEVMESPINPFVGVDYRPGIPMGRMADGRINTCPPTARDSLVPRPFDRAKYREISRIWLRHMVPSVRERKHLIKRAAWAVARPERTPQHIVVMQGMSGIGKSVMLDLIVRVSGRGASLFPESIFTTFNNLIARRSVVAIHEIHAPSERQKDIAGKLKELIANSTIEIEEKNRPKISVSNVIHWFAATNERVPFALEHGNDRFYFVTCGNPPDVGRMRRFFRKWVPIFGTEAFVDELNAGAKWLVNGFTRKVQQEMQGRAERQDVWARMEYASMRPWEKFLIMKMGELEEQAKEANAPLVFFAKDLVNLVLEKFQWRSADDKDILRRLGELGYSRINQQNGSAYQRRPEGGREKKSPIWGKADERAAFLQNCDPGTVKVFRLMDEG